MAPKSSESSIGGSGAPERVRGKIGLPSGDFLSVYLNSSEAGSAEASPILAIGDVPRMLIATSGFGVDLVRAGSNIDSVGSLDCLSVLSLTGDGVGDGDWEKSAARSAQS